MKKDVSDGKVKFKRRNTIFRFECLATDYCKNKEREEESEDQVTNELIKVMFIIRVTRLVGQYENEEREKERVESGMKSL